VSNARQTGFQSSPADGSLLHTEWETGPSRLAPQFRSVGQAIRSGIRARAAIRDHVISGPRFVRISETNPTVANAEQGPGTPPMAAGLQVGRHVAEMVDAQVVALRDAH
jgi:hypothetical protein